MLEGVSIRLRLPRCLPHEHHLHRFASGRLLSSDNAVLLNGDVVVGGQDGDLVGRELGTVVAVSLWPMMASHIRRSIQRSSTEDVCSQICPAYEDCLGFGKCRQG